jgi:hypothetical protein
MCCGRGKTRLQVNTPDRSAPRPELARTNPQAAPTFEYIGRTGLTVFGPISGVPYRFDGPGSRIRVDPRDRPAMTAIPVLKFVG